MTEVSSWHEKEGWEYDSVAKHLPYITYMTPRVSTEGREEEEKERERKEIFSNGLIYYNS